MPIDPTQLHFLASRLGTIGVRRREFLHITTRLLGGVVLANRLARVPIAAAQVPAGTKLAREQVLRWAVPNEPSSQDLNRYLYGGGDALLWAWLMKFDTDYTPVPWLAEHYEASARGDVYTFYLRPGLKWSNGEPCTAQDFVWSYQRKLNPATAADYPGFFYDIKNAEKINKGEIQDLSQLGVQAKDERTLEFTLDGPRGYFHVLMAYAATAPAHRATVEKFGDTWTAPAHIVCNGPFVLESWEPGKQFTLKKNLHYCAKDSVAIEKVLRPVIARQTQ